MIAPIDVAGEVLAKELQAASGQEVEHPKKEKLTASAWLPKGGFVWNPLAKWPVNEACWCGSGQKAKRCHLPKLLACVTEETAKPVTKLMSKGAFGRDLLRQAFAAKAKEEAEADFDRAAAPEAPAPEAQP